MKSRNVAEMLHPETREFLRQRREMMRRSRVACFVVVLGLSLVTIGNSEAWQLPRVLDGKVRFYNIAGVAFDQYSDQPSLTDQEWMRAHYVRMHTYSPYFDSRLSWYPKAWVYKDTFGLKRTSAIVAAHPEWILKDEAANNLYVRFACTGGTCTQYAADVGNPDFRANWIKEARALFAKGYKGIWLDDVNLAWRISNDLGTLTQPINPRTGVLMTLDEWQADLVTFLEQIRAAFPNIQIAHNSIWYADEFTDPEVLREIDAADYINMERGANDAGLVGGTGKFSFTRWLSFIDLVHARGKGVILMDYNGGAHQIPDSGTTVDTDLRAREFGLAAWFLVSSGVDLMSSNQLQWTAPGQFWPGYGLNLDKSLGARYTQQGGVLRRDFACGYVVLNPPGGSTVQITIAPNDRTIDGIAGGSVELVARSAAIIKHGCAKSLP